MAQGAAPLGIAVTYLLGPLIESSLGWRAALRAAGLGCVPWLLLWIRMDVDPSPAQAVLGPGASAGNRNALLSSEDASSGMDAGGRSIPWRRLLTEPAFLVIMLSHFAFAWGSYVMLAWLPTVSPHAILTTT